MTTSGCQSLNYLHKFCIFILILQPINIFCWDNDDLELFDLVEEVNSNFYDILEVPKTASSADIKRAYRKKTLLLHPDKNEAEDAEAQFRKLVAVYEVLKDDGKREKYNNVLENGLPDWRQPVFYYRKARKLGLIESGLILGLIITIGQYFVLWGSYLEKRLSMESFFESKMKKDKRGRKAAALNEQIETDMQEVLNAIPKPKLKNLWPVTFTKWAISIPAKFRQIQEWRKAEKERREMEIAEERERELEIARQREEFEQRKLRKKNRPVEIVENFHVKEANLTPVFYGSLKDDESETEDDSAKYTQRTGEWIDEDYVNLSKAYIRFPGGTANRWERIAEMVGRPVAEVTKKSKEMKGNVQMTLSSTVQGGTKNSKKVIDIKDDIISTADKESPISQTESGNKLRKRNKPAKDSTRTLMISSNEDVGVPSAGQTAESLISNGSTSQCTDRISQENFVTNSSNRQPVQQNGTEADKLVSKKSVNKSESISSVNDTSKASKMKDTDIDAADGENWSQNQQVILEWALRQYPKGTEQRWEKIADQIPGKNKEDCIARFKHLAELVKQKKLSTQS